MDTADPTIRLSTTGDRVFGAHRRILLECALESAASGVTVLRRTPSGQPDGDQPLRLLAIGAELTDKEYLPRWLS